MADVRAGAAGADVVVVGHIDIEDEFFRDGPESAGFSEGLAVARVGGVDGADFETRGEHLDALLAEEVGGREGLVAQIGVVGEGEGEFAVGEVRRGRGRMVEPLEEVAEGEEALVEGAYDFGV